MDRVGTEGAVAGQGACWPDSKLGDGKSCGEAEAAAAGGTVSGLILQFWSSLVFEFLYPARIVYYYYTIYLSCCSFAMSFVCTLQ